MSEWRELELVDCTVKGNISYGIVQPGQDEPNGVPILRVNNFENGILNTNSILKVSSKIESKHLKTRLKGGEVLLTLVGSTGQTAIVPEKLKGWNVARAVAVIDVKPEIGAKWINLWLRSNQAHHYLDSRANTTVQKTLNLKDVKSIPVSIPPENERRSIENIIYSLEEKIELNRQMNQTLEAMAQALFKSWFVDFDPVLDNAIAQGNEIPEELQVKAVKRKKVPADKKLFQTNPSLAAQFPVSFVFNETLGKWIPEGWEVNRIGECDIYISDFVANGSFASLKENVTLYPDKKEYALFMRNTDLKSGFEKKVYVDKRSYEFLKKSRLLGGEVIISNVGDVGSVYRCPDLDIPMTLGNNVILLNSSFNNFLYQFFICPLGQALIDGIKGGSAQPKFNKTDFKTQSILVPSNEILTEFERIDSLNRTKLESLKREIETLTQLRDRLLPELISGRVRVI